MESLAAFLHAGYLANVLPEVALELDKALRQEANVVNELVSTVILNILNTRTFGLEAHVDVFGHQYHFRAAVLFLQLKRCLNNTMIVLR